MASPLLLLCDMKIFFLMTFMFLSISALADSADSDNKLNPFESDGCSMVPDSEPFYNNDWLKCCTRHDFKYWQGGSSEEKEKADLDFKICLEKNNFGKWLSRIFYYGVSVGGTPSVKTTWRWGYGWNKTREFAPLSKSEKKQVENYSELLKLPVFLRTPEVVEWVRDHLTTRNSCKQDVLRKVKLYMNFKQPLDQLKIHRVEGKGGDRFQIFSPECKGGYIVVDFHASLHPDLCVFSEYFYNQSERIKQFTAYGTCTNFKK